MFIHNSPCLHPIIQLIIRYRYLLFLFFGLSIWSDLTVYENRSLYGIYVIIMIFLGMIFSPGWQGLLQSFLVTFCRFFISPDGFPKEIEIFLLQWLSFFAIWFVVSTLIKKNVDREENIIEITRTLAKSLDSRDKYTAFHSANVEKYAELIAIEMRLPKKVCQDIKLGARLHDIGKIGTPESILNKPSKLTESEYEVIKEHTTIGYEMVKHISLFEKSGVLDAILYHHEREDGSGYPEGLKGDQIPLIAKIIAVADSFDAMTSNRTYRDGNTFEYAVKEVTSKKGTHYDKYVVESFLRVIVRGEHRFHLSKT